MGGKGERGKSYTTSFWQRKGLHLATQNSVP
jgi:hypothetical protein